MNRRSFFRVAAVPLASAVVVSSQAAFGQDKPQPATVKDPVCGMKIDPAAAKGKAEYKGKTYYFCSDDCKTKFEKEPAKYADTAQDRK